jgi:hypothetical protein
MRGAKPALPVDTSKPVIVLPVRQFRTNMKAALTHGKPIVLGDRFQCFALVLPIKCSLYSDDAGRKAACKKARAAFAAGMLHLEK